MINSPGYCVTVVNGMPCSFRITGDTNSSYKGRNSIFCLSFINCALPLESGQHGFARLMRLNHSCKSYRLSAMKLIVGYKNILQTKQMPPKRTIEEGIVAMSLFSCFILADSINFSRNSTSPYKLCHEKQKILTYI